MTLDEAITLSKLSAPTPAQAGEALRVLVKELEEAQARADYWHETAKAAAESTRVLAEIIGEHMAAHT